MSSTKLTPGYNMGHGASTGTHEARSVQNTAAFLIPYIKPTDHILDVGCGPGTITVGFADLVPQGQVTGLDYSAGVIEKAKKYLSEHQGSNHDEAKKGKISFTVGDFLDRLPYEDDTFDLIWTSQVIVHLKGKQPVDGIRELWRVLKPGGIFASSEMASCDFFPYHQELDSFWTQNVAHAITGLNYFNGVAMRQIAREAGFSPKKIKSSASCDIKADPEGRKVVAESFSGRLDPGTPFRAAWLEYGIPEEEVERCREYLQRWLESEDAWYCMTRAETICWK